MKRISKSLNWTKNVMQFRVMYVEASLVANEK